MDLIEAQELAVDAMQDHGLDDWRFSFDRAVRRFGECRYDIKMITLSKKLVELNSEDAVRNTLLHEIAHALAGHAAGHGMEWQRIAKSIGSDGKRLHTAATPPSRYVGVCPNCHHILHRNRKPSRGRFVSCASCCNRYNGGKYSIKYLIRWVDNKTLSSVQ